MGSSPGMVLSVSEGRALVPSQPPQPEKKEGDPSAAAAVPPFGRYRWAAAAAAADASLFC